MYTREDMDRKGNATAFVADLPQNANVERIARLMNTIDEWKAIEFPEGCGIAYKRGYTIIGENGRKKLVHTYFHIPYWPEGKELTDEMHQKMYGVLVELVIEASKNLMEQHGVHQVDGLIVSAPDYMIATLDDFLDNME